MSVVGWLVRESVTGTGEIVGTSLIVVKKKNRLRITGFAALASTLVLSGCGEQFSAACKSNINESIALQAQTRQLSGVFEAQCAGLPTSDLAAACADLKASTASLKGSCGDAYGEALDASLMGKRQ
jgi:hypothetical protein